jgi:hypothetical protein
MTSRRSLLLGGAGLVLIYDLDQFTPAEIT